MKLEDFVEITDAIYCIMNGTICEMWLPQLKETTWHILKWNNSPVSLIVLGFVCCCFFFAEICYLHVSMLQRLLKFSEIIMVQIIVKK